MSTVINSIHYKINPDKDTQALCESIIKEIDGNGVSLSDITVDTASSKNTTVTTQFIWAVKVTLKSSIMSGKETKNATLHNSAPEAQAAAKKQGMHIIQNSLGKIELINNINEDPEHFFKHSAIKLNGGKSHAFIETCERHCDRGQVTCPRCRGVGTHKAITKKENLLGTTGNFAAINTCPDCKGKGTVNCSNCAGSGETKRVYTVHVDASRKHKDSVDIKDATTKKTIETFLAHQSHNDLFNDYLSPVLSELKDIDKDHCGVLYQSKTKYIDVNLSILNKVYGIMGFGNHSSPIAKPKILDDTLLPAINKIIGISPKINSSSKYSKLQAIPLISLVFNSDKNRSEKELETLLNKNANGLISRENTHLVIKKVSHIKTLLTPSFSFYSWLPVVVISMISSLYFNLKITPINSTLIILAIHFISASSIGYLLSKNITRFKRSRMKAKIDSPTRERIPLLLVISLITATTFIPSALSTDSRWNLFFISDQYIRTLTTESNTLDSEIISNTNLIKTAKLHLIVLGYKNIKPNGNYTKETEVAVMDLQKKLGLKETKYINETTMRLIEKYAIIKENNFK